MKKIFLFKKNLFEKLLTDGYEDLSLCQLFDIVEVILEKRVEYFKLPHLLDKGVEKKIALLVSTVYEIARRENHSIFLERFEKKEYDKTTL